LDWKDIDLYRFFAFVLGSPTRERFEFLSHPEAEPSLSRLWSRLDCLGEFPGLDACESYEEYESTYIALFDVGLPEPPVPLLESAYHKSLPAQQTALENVLAYEVLGLHTTTSCYSPDHLVTQLEFLSAIRYTRENSTNEQNRHDLSRLEYDFLERHLLNWLPLAHEKLAQCRTPVFHHLMTLLLAFLRRQRGSLSF